MSIDITFNGVEYSIPEFRDTDYANELTQFFVAIPNGVLQPTAGLFTLLAELDFGASFGVKALYMKSRAVNPATAGAIRLGSSDVVSFRNNANSENLDLAIDGSNNLMFNGALLATNATVINAGSQYQLGYYAAAGQAISPLTLITASRAIVSDVNGLPVAATTTAAEIGYVNGVTSAIQTQLDLKAPLASPTFAGTVTIPTPFILGAVSVTATGTELNYSIGVTSAIQTQLNLKAPLASPTFSGTITTPLTASRALVTGASSELAVSAVTATELGFVSGVTSAIQTQLNGKVGTTGNETIAGNKTFSGVVSKTGQPAFLVTFAAGGTNVTGDGTSYTIPWDGEVYDQASNFSSPTFTAPVTGKYLLNAHIFLRQIDSTHTTVVLEIVTTNRTYANTWTQAIQNYTGMTLELNVIADMSASDTAIVRVRVSGGTKTVDVDNSAVSNFFSGCLVA